jgi:hypothetical protein
MDEDSARMDREVGYVRGVRFIHQQQGEIQEEDILGDEREESLLSDVDPRLFERTPSPVQPRYSLRSGR